MQSHVNGHQDFFSQKDMDFQQDPKTSNGFKVNLHHEVQDSLTSQILIVLFIIDFFFLAYSGVRKLILSSVELGNKFSLDEILQDMSIGKYFSDIREFSQQFLIN